ncbi:THUMP domain-containing protein 1 homolog [Chironomus tepperi]|uniref:THUMP domain-containing protein 1 homolog n=1 Tax=Chironomus tepperi TaxID=113505 RepID=UPI00391F1F5D
MASPAKKPKFNSKAKNYFIKQNQQSKKAYLKAGDQGFLVTFNYKANDSVREVYRLLNEYYREYFGGKGEIENKVADPDIDDDIEDQLSKAIDKTKQESEKKAMLFQSVDTGANGVVFIKSNIDEFFELGEKIIRDLFTTQQKKTKFTNRMLPIMRTCRAKMEDIVNTSGELFDQHFLKEPSTFAIIFNKRLNNDIQRDDVIKELAALVSQKNMLNKVNLKEPKKTILVEIIKGLCCLTVVTDYILLKKYNLNELTTKPDSNKAEKAEKEPEEKVQDPVELTTKPDSNNGENAEKELEEKFQDPVESKDPESKEDN